MNKSISIEDIDPQVVKKIYTQQYAEKKLIDGIKIIPCHVHLGDDSDLSEILKIGSDGKIKDFPGFTVLQINRSTQFAGSIKAWHLHFKQDELWYVPSGPHLTVGLWDVRKDSSTRGMVNRLILGGPNANLLFICKGIAHGSANNSQLIIPIIYFVNQHFNKEYPDEHRIPWDALGVNFWQPVRD